jgi:hypothetical protein
MMRPSSVSTFITRLAWAGIALNKVKRLLGYKSPMMTQCYAHHYPEGLRDGMGILDRLARLAQFRTARGIID